MRLRVPRVSGAAFKSNGQFWAHYVLDLVLEEIVALRETVTSVREVDHPRSVYPKRRCRDELRPAPSGQPELFKLHKHPRSEVRPNPNDEGLLLSETI